MDTLIATYRIVTPMFIGDGNQQATAIRPPSVKGALRFWWRALQWGKIRPQWSCDELALQELHETEACLFGCAAKEEHGQQAGGQGKFLLRVIQQANRKEKELEAKWPEKNTGSAFLGFGILESGKEVDGDFRPHREGIKEIKDNKFTLRLDFKLNTSQEDIDSIEQVLYVFGLLGGLGSRARRGFGSVALTEFQRNKEAVKNLPYTKQQYQQVIDELLAQYQKVIEYPPYTAFSKQTLLKFVKTDQAIDARQIHNKMGLDYKNFRLGFKKSDKSKKRAFGLPLASYDENNRRSSPLFFHMHPLADNTFVGIALYLPAVFHYEKDEYKDTQTFLEPVKQFMESLK